MSELVATLNGWAEHWWVYVAQATWQSTLIAAAVLVFITIARRVPPTWRYGLLLIALAKFAVPPLFTAPVGLFHWAAPTAETPPQPAASRPPVTPTGPVGMLGGPAGGGGGGPGPGMAPPNRALLPAPAAPAPPLPMTNRKLSRLVWPMLGHAAISALLLAAIVVSLARVILRARRAELVKPTSTVTGALHQQFARLAHHLGISDEPQLLIADDGRPPAAIWLLQPKVIIPRSLLDRLAPAELDGLLANLLVRHRRNDGPAEAAAQLVLAAWWFNPFLWLLDRAITRTRHQCCDDAVLVSGLTEPNTYERAITQSGATHTRVARLHDESLAREPRLSGGAMVAVALFGLVLLPGVRSKPGQPRTRVYAVPQFMYRTAYLTGRVLDPSGQPIEDATVEIFSSSTQARTDADGRYIAAGYPGDQSIAVHADGYLDVDIFDAQRVALIDGEQVTQDFTLRPANQLLVKVVDEAGQPIAGAHILVMGLTGVGGFGDIERPMSGGLRGSPFQTDAQGLWRQDLPMHLRRVRLHVMHAEYATTWRVVAAPRARESSTVTISLHKGVEMPGVAVWADGAPAEEWQVQVGAIADNVAQTAAQAPIDSEGRFALKHIVPGRYQVAVVKPPQGGSPAGHPEEWHIPIGRMELPPKDGELRITIPRPSPRSGAEIELTLLDEQPQLPGVLRITAESADGVQKSFQRHLAQRSFTISGLAPGEYRLSFELDGKELKSIEGVHAPSVEPVEVELGLPPPRTVTGRVINGLSGEPVAKFTVRPLRVQKVGDRFLHNILPGHNVTHQEGAFEMTIPGGPDMKLRIEAEGFAPKTLDLAVPGGAAGGEPLVVEMDRGRTLVGRVLDVSGNPVDGATVLGGEQAEQLETFSRFTSDPRGWLRFLARDAATTRQGRFELPRLATPVVLAIVHPDYQPLFLRDVKLEEQVTELPEPIVLAAGATVEGRVLDAEGRPRDSIMLYFTRQPHYASLSFGGFGSAVEAETDDQGRYTIKNLADGDWHVHLENERELSGIVRQSVKVEAGGAPRLDFGVGPCELTGRLLLGGAPAANIQLQLVRGQAFAPSFRALVTTDAAGGLRLRGLPRGAATLQYLPHGAADEWRDLEKVELTDGITDLGDLSPD